MYNQQAPFFTQLSILTKRLLLRVIRRPLSELPNLFISAFFLFIYDGALGRVFGSSSVGTSLDFAQGNFVNFILPVSIISASLSGLFLMSMAKSIYRFSYPIESSDLLLQTVFLPRIQSLLRRITSALLTLLAKALVASPYVSPEFALVKSLSRYVTSHSHGRPMLPVLERV